MLWHLANGKVTVCNSSLCFYIAMSAAPIILQQKSRLERAQVICRYLMLVSHHNLKGISNEFIMNVYLLWTSTRKRLLNYIGSLFNGKIFRFLPIRSKLILVLSFLSQKSDILQRKIRVRPDRSQLIQRHILEGKICILDTYNKQQRLSLLLTFVAD